MDNITYDDITILSEYYATKNWYIYRLGNIRILRFNTIKNIPDHGYTVIANLTSIDTPDGGYTCSVYGINGNKWYIVRVNYVDSSTPAVSIYNYGDTQTATEALSGQLIYFH